MSGADQNRRQDVEQPDVEQPEADQPDETSDGRAPLTTDPEAQVEDSEINPSSS